MGSGSDHEQPGGEQAGSTIDRYTLIEEIGEGGMGTVWLAEQLEPVKRRVALKIIKLGMDTREVVARFEAERQALATMDHPHIAKVLDGGATAGGRPYFVMELVEGEPITTFCNDHRLDITTRLNLVQDVCHALQHAHQKGIIHRDIKPSNVLVGEQDGVPVPKVIDFGIAKATGPDLAEQSMLTQQQQVLGTPEYMAPEQAGGSDVDTRADVYSLGVMLYELMTGTKPFELAKVLEHGYFELMRTIREVDPERPSTRVSSLEDTATTVAEERRIPVDQLTSSLRGELDWIVMKALEKAREQRYESASALADDIGRYLAQEPVLAHPQSASYRLRKFVRRKKKTVAAVATIAVLLVVGSVGTGVGWYEASTANAALQVAVEEKEAQRKVAVDAAERAQRAEAKAAKRADELEQVSLFQAAQLRSIDPATMGSSIRGILLGEMPDSARAVIEPELDTINFTTVAMQWLRENLFDQTFVAINDQFVDQPIMRAVLLQSLVDQLQHFGLAEAALEPQEIALELRRAECGDDHGDTMRSVAIMGTLLQQLGDLDGAEVYYRESLTANRRVYGDEHLGTLQAINNLASLMSAKGERKESERLMRQAYDTLVATRGPDHDESLTTHTNLCGVLRDLGQLRESADCYRDVIERLERVRGEENHVTLVAMGQYGSLLRALGEYDESERWVRRALAVTSRVYGDDHPTTISRMINLAMGLEALNRFEEAEVLLRDSLGRSRKLGDSHPKAIEAMEALATHFMMTNRLPEAEPLFAEALELGQKLYGDEHPTTLKMRHNYGISLMYRGQFAEAETIFREGARLAEASAGLDHPLTAGAIEAVGTSLRYQGKLEEAAPFSLRALEARRRFQGSGHPETLLLIQDVARLLRKLGREDEALALFIELAEHFEARHEAEPAAGHDAAAAKWRQEAGV